EADAAFFVITPHQNLVGTLDDFHHGTFTPTAAVNTADSADHPVTIEHQAHLRWPEEHILAAVVRHQEAEPVPVPLDPTADQIELVHRRIGATAGIDQLTVALHGAQAPTQGLDAVFIVEAELLLQLGTGRRRATLGQEAENEFATGDGIIVFL